MIVLLKVHKVNMNKYQTLRLDPNVSFRLAVNLHYTITVTLTISARTSVDVGVNVGNRDDKDTPCIASPMSYLAYNCIKTSPSKIDDGRHLVLDEDVENMRCINLQSSQHIPILCLIIFKRNALSAISWSLIYYIEGCWPGNLVENKCPH